MSFSQRLDLEPYANQPAPYLLRSVLEDVPLAEDGAFTDAHITCVEFWSRLGTTMSHGMSTDHL